MLGSYLYVIGISYDKTHFTYIYVNSSRSKMIITSDYIENMKITQELLKKRWICRSRYGISDTACNVLIPKGYLFMGLHNP